MTTTVSYRLLEAALSSKHLPVLMTGEGTHDAALAFVAQLVPFIQDENHIRTIVAGALPVAYAGDTLKQVPEMLKSAIRKRFDQVKPMPKGVKKKRNEVDDAVDFFFESGAEVFRCDLERAYARIPTEEGGFINYPVKAANVRTHLTRLYRKQSGLVLSRHHVDEALHALYAIALTEGTLEQVALRVGGDRKRFWIDLCRADGQLVEVDAQGYRLTFDSDVKLIRTSQLGAMPIPVPGDVERAGLDAFAKLFGLRDSNRIMVLGFMLAALAPNGPYTCLMVEGQQGSGKSVLCQAIKDCVDPGNGRSSRFQRDEHNLLISASRRHLSMFDNASFIKDDMSDALCCLATGTGFETRELYSDDGVVNFTMAKPFVLNGITSIVRRPDLLDRSIPIQLPPIQADTRQDQEDLEQSLLAIRPAVLHDLFTALSQAVANVDKTPLPRELRMAGQARWVEAASTALGFEPGSFVAAVLQDQNVAQGDIVRDGPIAQHLIHALRGFTREAPFKGTMSELYKKMSIGNVDRDRYYPADASAMSKKLKPLAPALAKIDVFIEFPQRTNTSRLVLAWLGPSFPVEKPRTDELRQEF